MPRRRLKTILDELQEQLGSGEQLTDDDREALRSLVSNLQEVVDPDIDSDDESVITDLRDATVRFESTHPRLTRTLASISDLLRSMGLS